MIQKPITKNRKTWPKTLQEFIDRLDTTSEQEVLEYVIAGYLLSLKKNK